MPILLHLLRRRIGLRVEFPAARYLARAEREHSRTLRLRNLLLMLLRVLIVGLIALMRGPPNARGSSAPGTGPTALAVVLDNSLEHERGGCGGRPLLGDLGLMRDGATSDVFVVVSASPTDRLWLITRRRSHPRGGTPNELAAAAQHVTALGGAGDPAMALARAVAAVQSAGAACSPGDPALPTDKNRRGVAGALPPTNVQRCWRGIPGSYAASEPRRPQQRQAQPVRWTPHGAVAASGDGQ